MNLERRHLEKGMSYQIYRELIDALLLDGKTTGNIQSSTLTNYARLNLARMKRVDKTIELLPTLQEIIRSIEVEQTWVVLTEGWCGDNRKV